VTPSGETFSALAAGSYHACGLRRDGTATCWGNDEHGQLATPASAFTALAAGYGFSCGLLASGDVECWGERPSAKGTEQIWVPMAAFSGGNFVTIGAGAFHACGIDSAGKVTCWGDNFYGQLNVP
jgi:alpha-tubulin suppressor-like RCC1 family protein